MSQQQVRLQLRQSRDALIDSIKHRAPTERLTHIISDDTHPVNFYPAEWANLDPDDIQELPPSICLAAIQRLAGHRTGIWKELREQIENRSSKMSTSTLPNYSTSSPRLDWLNRILEDLSPRPDGTLTRYEEKVRLAWPQLLELYSRIPSSVREARKLDSLWLLGWLDSHWTDYPEPKSSFISRLPEENQP